MTYEYEPMDFCEVHSRDKAYIKERGQIVGWLSSDGDIHWIDDNHDEDNVPVGTNNKSYGDYI